MKIVSCPNCLKRMVITELHCSECNITIKGHFQTDRFSNLNDETIDFIETFLLARGSITEIEKRLGISYPTVKTKIEKMIKEIKKLIEIEEEQKILQQKKLEEEQKKENKLKEIYRKK